MGCQNSKVRSASTTEAAPFKPAVAKDALASRTFSLPPASPISSPARSRRASDADSQHAAAAVAAVAAAVPTVEPEVTVVETNTEVPTTEAAPVAVLEEAPVADGSNDDAIDAAVVAEEDEKADAEATVATTTTTTVTEEEEAPVVDEVAPVPSTVTFVEEAKPEEVEEKNDEAKEASVAAVVAMEERPKSATNVRRVAFDKETMRLTAPRSAPAVPPAGTRLTKKQQQMYQAGHKSAGRRGPVASKHSRCKAQMQDDVYLAMANAFERLLTNVNTIDAHLDSR